MKYGLWSMSLFLPSVRQADMSHILNAHQLPVVQTDRGGEVTYHGPGHAVVYPLLFAPRLR